MTNIIRLPLSAFCLLSSLHSLATTLPALPEAVSNQAALSTSIRGKTYIGSFAGLAAGKTQADVHQKAWLLTQGDSSWQKLTNVPNSLGHSGRLAVTATTLDQHFYLFGGYSVAKDGSETTLPDSYRFSPISKNYTKLPDMPVAVDDSVALPYQNRYIYLVSGWHNDGNVNLVQVFDNFTQKWFQATPFPGQPVFGHAGTISGNRLLICDGVKTELSSSGQQTERRYAPSAACYKGEIDSKNFRKISWQPVAHPSGKARYRQVAVAVTLEGNDYFAFIGGTQNPYNFNGIGYNGQPSEPDNTVWLYQLAQQRWRQGTVSQGVMDARNLVVLDGDIYSLGGMAAGQQLQSGFIKQQISLLPE